MYDVMFSPYAGHGTLIASWRLINLKSFPVLIGYHVDLHSHIRSVKQLLRCL